MRKIRNCAASESLCMVMVCDTYNRNGQEHIPHINGRHRSRWLRDLHLILSNYAERERGEAYGT